MKKFSWGNSSFRSGILRTFILFQTLLILFGIGWVIVSYTDGQDGLQEAIAITESQQILERYRQDPNIALPVGVIFSAFIGTQDMPPAYRELLKDLPVGMHELSEADVIDYLGYESEHEFHVLVHELESGGPFFYFVSDIPEQTTQDLLIENVLTVVFTYVTFSVLLGGWLAWIFARNISQPLEDITNAINEIKTEDPTTRLSQTWREGEIGELARSLDEKNQRIADFIQREKGIMRNISHELRTPITIIKSTLALAGLKSSAEASHHVAGDRTGQTIEVRHLEKIERASRDLEAMIEAFLWLGREFQAVDDPADATSCVERAIADHHYLVDEKPIDLDVDLQRQVKIPGKDQLVYIAAANLIRNAFSHTEAGRIKIRLNENSLTVQDDGPGFETQVAGRVCEPGVKSSNSQGFGLGLHIVEQVCQRMGWHLEIASSSTGSIVSIVFVQAS